MSQPFDHSPDVRDLLGIAFGQLAATKPQRVFKADANMATKRSRHGGKRHLTASRTKNRPLVFVAEQPIGRALHVHHVLRMGTDPSENAEHRLDEQRRLHKAALQEMMQVVEMRGVVALELEARSAL